MNRPNAPCALRELRAIRGAIFFVAVVLAVLAGLRLGEALTVRDPSLGVTNELIGIRNELNGLRTNIERQHGGPNTIIPVPPAKVEKAP